METKEPEGKILNAVENLIDEERVINFSDAVFAFAATLLVLKIDLPNLTASELSSARLTQELINLWPSYMANIISFLIIAYYWLTHHAIFSLVKKLDTGIIWINVIFLIFLSFLPFPVDLFGEYSNSDIIIAFYCFSLSLVGFLLATIWFYALKKKLVTQNLSRREINYYSSRFLLTPTIFALSVPISFIDPMLSKICWIFVLIGIFIINRSFKLKKLSVIEKDSI